MISEIVRVTKARRSGAGFIGHCPAHEDSKPSLSIAEKEGKVLVKCHRGCDGRLVIEALKGLGAWKTMQENKVREIVDKYEYTDELGKPIYCKLRLPDKNWSIGYYQDGKLKHGGMTEAKVRRVLFNLVGIEQARKASQPVWFVEGEKDAKSLIALGAIATTNDSGAGAGKVKPEMLESLKGLDVILCGDNDEVGKAHIDYLAKQLVAYAARVQRVEIPKQVNDRPVKDITDYLNVLGHSKDAVIGLHQTAQQVYPIKLVTTYAELLSLDLPEPSTWMGGFVAPGEATLIVALPGVGKTWFTLAIAQCLADGKQPLGPWRPEAKLKTLIVDFEMGPMRVRQRLEALRKGYGLSDEVAEQIGLICPELTLETGIMFNDLGQPEQVKILMDAMQSFDLVIIDNVNAAYPSAEDDENSPKFWVQPQALVMALKRLNKACIMVHHATKGDPKNPAGSGKNIRFFDNVMALVDETDYAKTDRKKIKFWFKKSRNFALAREMQPEMELQDMAQGTYWAMAQSAMVLPEIKRDRALDLNWVDKDDIPW